MNGEPATTAPQIYVDADACPVKDEILRVATRHDLSVYMVSNSYMRLADSPLIKRIIVAEGPDAADDWIAEHITPSDIAVTSDIPLALRCINKGARVTGPTGKPFDESSIGMAVAMRDLMGHLRDTGEIRGGGPAFSKQDRSRFLSTLENIVQAVKRG